MIDSLYDKFKPWSDGGSVWIISDTHFDDPDCKFMDKNWITPEEQVKLINKYVYPTDTLIILGDIGDPSYVKQLRGYKVLIMGNHDQSKKKYAPYFDEVYEGALFIGEKILLSHEPINLPFCLNIHGHDHNYKEYYDDNCHHYNMATNVIDYKPKNLGKLIKMGCLSGIENIHRQTINKASEKKE